MNGNQQGRRQNKKAPASAKGKGGGRGGRKRGRKKATTSAIDPKRPMWENPAGEAELSAIVGSVRPAQNPTALVRSLGDPPLGKYATTAHHYYEAVYDKAQHFAVAIATANGLLVVDDSIEGVEEAPEGNPADGSSGDPATTVEGTGPASR